MATPPPPPPYKPTTIFDRPPESTPDRRPHLPLKAPRAVVEAGAAIIKELMEQATEEERRTALAWVTVVTDEETGKVSVHGFYSEADVVVAAAEFQEQLNRGNPASDAGWTVVARPVLPKD